eukprot:641309_1
MGALCTSDANRGLHEDGRRHPNTDQSSSKPSRTNQQTSMAKNAALNNVVLDQIRNSPDDPNLIIINDLTLSNHASQNNNNPPLNYHQSYTSFSPMMSPTRQLSNDSVTEKDTMLQLWCNDINDIYLPPQQTITIGDEIELTARYNSLHGVVKFIGEIVNATGVFYGIELNKPKGSDEVFQFRKLCNGINGFDANQNTGHIDNVCYFTSDAHEALFVHKGQIGRILKVNYDMPRLGIHSQIYLPQYKCNGTVKYIGRPHHTHLIYYGIELDIGYGVYLDCTELSHWILPSRYNLLLHGFVDSSDVNIPSGIVKLIKHYHNKMEIRLTSVPQRIGDSIKVICKKYEPFDIDNNICGPAITIRCTRARPDSTSTTTSANLSSSSSMGNNTSTATDGSKYDHNCSTDTNKVLGSSLQLISENHEEDDLKVP